MKYDFTPKALNNLRNEANQHFDDARGVHDEKSELYEKMHPFSQGIPSKWHGNK